MKNIKLFAVLFTLFISISSYSQNCSNIFITAKYGIEHNIKGSLHQLPTIQLQIGSMLNDYFGVNLDMSHDLDNCTHSMKRIGINTIYQFNSINSFITPLISLGIGHKNYEIDNKWSYNGFDVKLLAMVDIPIYNNLCLNIGAGISKGWFNSFRDEWVWCNNVGIILIY